jgi:hypothetical protein
MLPLLMAGGVAPQLARADYVESHQSWSATSAATWEVKDLSGAPFNVPANAVVEITIAVDAQSQPRSVGVRAVGSSLQRRVELESTGSQDVVVMTVQADASSRIEHYAETTGDAEFILVGYWTTGTYVERFDSFTAAASASWQDHDLSSYGVGADDVAEVVVVNNSGTAAQDVGVRANASSLARRIDLRKAGNSPGVSVATMFVQADGTANATIEVYAEDITKVDFYVVGYWSSAPATYIEKFVSVARPTSSTTWEATDLTTEGVPGGATAEFLLANAANAAGDFGIRATGSSSARIINLDKGSGTDDVGRIHANTDGNSELELYDEDVAATHEFYLIGYWEVATGLKVANHTAGNQSNAFTNSGGETNAELVAFALEDLDGDTSAITQMVFTLSDIVGLTDGSWAGIEIVVDDNGDGDIQIGETTTVGGAGVVNTAGGTITFSTSFNVSSATDYILRADFATLSQGDGVTVQLASAGITTTDPVSGASGSAIHVEGSASALYVETYQSWSANSTNRWEIKDLSGAPFNVPANAVVEVAVGNTSGTSTHTGGVRAAGSPLERKFELDKAASQGTQWVVMYVQVDSSSRISTYASKTQDVDFVLLGYWDSGTYVERFDSFTAGASASWQTHNLGPTVGAGQVAEIVMDNSASNAREAGVRSSGSSLERRLDLQDGKGSGAVPAVMFVQADGTANAEIEVYAEVDADVDFYLVGYWSTPPSTTYTEAFADIGSPTADATWQDKNLSGAGVPGNAVAEISLVNNSVSVNQMGVRKDASALARLLTVNSYSGEGSDIGRMHVTSDGSSTIEFYHEDISDAHVFRLTGYWTDNTTPDAPSGLGPAGFVGGLCSLDTTPTLDLTQSDSDVGETLAFQIQIDDSSDFSSAVVDYQSAVLAQGATSFTVGQAAGGGSYTAGSQGQTLAAASYYWRVRSYDGTTWSDWSTAYGGSVAFETAAICPHTVGPVGASECGGSGCDYQSLQTAIDAVAAGETVTVYRRTDDAANNECYDEHITIGTANLTLQGASTTPASAACIGPASGGHIVTITASGVTLKNLHISGKANDGAGGTNSKGNGGRASGHGVLVLGPGLVAHVENCTIDFTGEDNIRYEGGHGPGYVTIKQCYLHHSDTNRNIRTHRGGGDASNRHVIRNCLIHSGGGILVSGGAEYVTVDRNVIRGWPYWGHLGGSYPELRSAGFGGGWRYYSNCAAGVWVVTTDPADLQVTNNLIVGTRWGIRVNIAGNISNNTVVNPFNATQYDYDSAILASDIRDHTFGLMVADGFAGTVQNNLIVVTADNRATGEPGQASSPYYTPGITGYGIGFLDNTGTLGGAANISNNNVWGFVDTNGTTALNYGSGITQGATNLSVDPQFATDNGDESNGGSAPCLADGNDVGDTRCYDLYVDNFFLSTTQASGSCHASVLENTAGAPEYVDLSGGGTRDPDTDDLSGLDDCSYAADVADSRAIDFGSGAVGSEPEKNGDAPNLGAFGGTDRASLSSTLRVVAVDVGDGGVKNGDSTASVPGVVQPRSDGLTEVNVYLNRAFSASSSSFVIRDYCDTTTLTAPTVDTTGASVPPYVAKLTWPASTFTDQAIRIHVLGDGADRIVDNEGAEDLDGEVSGVHGGTLPSGDGTAGGDAEVAVFALTGDVDGDRTVEGQSGQDDYDAITGYAGYPAGSCSACPEDIDADGDVDDTDLAAVTAADGTSLGTACTLLQDDFNRADNTTVGNSWSETEGGPSAEAQILSNRLNFASNGDTNEPLVSHTLTSQSSGTMTWTFTFNMERTGVDNTFEVRMQLGDSALLVSPDTSDNTGVAVNLIWGSDDQGLTNHEGFGYDLGGSVTEVGVVSGDAGSNAGGDATVTVTADLDANTFDLAVTGSGLVSGTGTATGVAFDNNVDIDSVRIYLDGVKDNAFGDLEIDDVTVTHDPG